ncbi:MAG: NADH oxidoreductase [Halobacteriovorax sp.]|nr:NADH oxidoreductase [Halobacteriovorax sp.]
MNLKELTEEKRKEILKAADKRIEEGRILINSGFKDLNITSEVTDYLKLENALEEIKQGVSQFNSGIAANKAIKEGKAPQNIALRWFKKEMNLIPMSLQAKQKHSFLLGMSFFHTSIMVILILFMLIMIWMYFFKMKRAAILLEGLSKKVPAENTEPEIIEDREPKIKETVNESKSISKIEKLTKKYSGPLKIIGIFDEAPAVKTFRLANIDDSSLAFNYEPGQFVTFVLDIDGKKVRRSYTIASSPTVKDFIEVTIKREDKGLVSKYFHDDLKLYDVVEVNAPYGKFYFNGTDANSIVLISGGVGVTPMMSAVRYLTAKCWTGEIYFLFCSKTSEDFIYQKELEYLQSRHANLNVLASMTRAKGTSWMGPQGRFTKELINNFIPDLNAKAVHICGPIPMMDAVKLILAELGVPKEKIKTEAFGSAKPKTEKKVNAVANKKEPKKLTFTVLNKTVDITSEQTILEAAEENGIEIENSCRSGECGMCKVKLLSGIVSMEAEDSLEDDEKREGIILACQAKTNGNVSIEV